MLWSEERTNYPLTFSIDDLGDDFLLTAQVETSVGAARVCDFMQTARRKPIVRAGAVAGYVGVPQSTCCPRASGSKWSWIGTERRRTYSHDRCLHELFE